MDPDRSFSSTPSAVDHTPKRTRWHRNEQDVLRWADLFKSGLTIVHIAERFKVAPSTIGQELHKLGIVITPGHHVVKQLPLKYSPEFIELVKQGPESVINFVSDRVWGISVTEDGSRQVQSFCKFIHLHQEGIGVTEIARRLALHRSTVAEWREGTDQPYIIRAAYDTFPLGPRPGWKFLPTHLTSGGNLPSGWIQVPTKIQSFGDVVNVIKQLRPLEGTYGLASIFGLTRSQVEVMRTDLFGYLLGIVVGDSGKLGGAQNRYASMNLDLQLTKKQETNKRMGAFVICYVNSLGIEMDRIKDKPPTGRQLLGKDPSPSYRWSSNRSPLIAWMFSVCLGLAWGETTTTHPLHMEWILKTPRSFRIRFVQGAADSDGCVKRYVVEIASVPNSDFFARVLQGLGLSSAHIAYEKNLPLKIRLNSRQAASLPIFNEHVRSYRYQKLMQRNRRFSLNIAG